MPEIASTVVGILMTLLFLAVVYFFVRWLLDDKKRLFYFGATWLCSTLTGLGVAAHPDVGIYDAFAFMAVFGVCMVYLPIIFSITYDAIDPWYRKYKHWAHELSIGLVTK